MIKIVYFDRNVINRIKKQLIVSDADYLLLRSAVRDGRFIAPISITLLEETLPIVEVRSALKRTMEQQIMTELFNWDWLVKPHMDLLSDDIKSFAKGEALSFPFLSLNMRHDEFFNPEGQSRKEILRIIEETKLQKDAQFEDMKEARRQYQERFKTPPINSFENFWDQFSGQAISRIAEGLGVLQECNDRGLEKLLRVKSARLYSAWRLAYDYNTLIRGRKIMKSDSRDHHHAVLASVADIFVTEDQRFAEMLRQVPIEGFEVIDLRTLIQRLRHPSLFGFDAHDYHP